MRRLREKKELPLWQVGKLTGISASQLSKVERDLDFPRSDVLFRLAQYYGVTMESLMNYHNPIPQDQLALAEVGVAAIVEKLEEMYEVVITKVELVRATEGHGLVRIVLYSEED